MRKFNMHEAKTNLSKLVRLALEGERDQAFGSFEQLKTIW